MMQTTRIIKNCTFFNSNNLSLRIYVYYHEYKNTNLSREIQRDTFNVADCNIKNIRLKNIKYYFFSEQWIENKWKVS